VGLDSRDANTLILLVVLSGKNNRENFKVAIFS